MGAKEVQVRKMLEGVVEDNVEAMRTQIQLQLESRIQEVKADIQRLAKIREEDLRRSTIQEKKANDVLDVGW